MQTKDRQGWGRENKAQHQLLYAGVTLVALSTGLMISAQSAQAATDTTEPATTTVKNSESSAPDEVATSAKVAGNPTSAASDESQAPSSVASQSSTAPSSVTGQASSTAPSSVNSQVSSTASGEPVAAQQPSQAESPAVTNPSINKEPVEKPTEPVQPPVVSTESLRVKTSSVVVNNFRKVSAMDYSLRLNQIRPSLLLSRSAVVPTSVDDTTPDADGFSYTFNGDSYVITGYSGTSKNIVIPDIHNGSAGSHGVTEIANNVFQNAGITSLAMGANIQIIGEAAFEDNLLTTIDFSKDTSSLWDIKANAFNSNQLTMVSLPESVTTIGPNAFQYNALTSIHLDNALTTIGASSFANNQLVRVVIPDNVTTVGESAFTSNETLTNLTLGKKVNTIGATAFAGDAVTGNLFIPDSVETIGQSAFVANKITGLTIGDGASKLVTIGNLAFLGNPTLTGALVLSDKMSFIGSNAFVGDSLTSIDFGKWEQGPNGEATIGDNAFSGNKLTGMLTLADGIQHIGNSTFAGNQLTGLKLGTDLLTIGSSAFAGNSQLTGTLTIPDLVTSIGENAFTNAKLTGLVLGQKVNSIGSSAFAENQLAGTLEIPDSVKSIGDSAFASNKLRGLQLDGTVNSVGIGSFAGNDLQKIQAVQLVTHLGDRALAGQKTLAVTVNKSGNQLTGVRAAISKQLQLKNFNLTVPMAFMLGDTPVTYDFTTDSLTLPADFAGNSLTLSLSSGTTAEATDHSGNYGVEALTLSWSIPSSGSGTTPMTPVKPTEPITPTKPTLPSKPVKPTKPTTPNRPSKPTNKAKPTKRAQKKVPTRKAKQHRTKGMAVKRAGQRVTFKLAGSAASTGFNGAQQGMSSSTWSYTQQSVIAKRGSKVNGQETQVQTQLPQTLEKDNYWSAIGAALLAVLTWLGLGERRRRQ